MESRRTTTMLAAGVLVLACGGEALDVGSNRDPAVLGGGGNVGGSGGSTSTQTNDMPLPTWPDTSACAMPGNLPIAGVYEGHVPSILPLDTNDTTIRVTIGGTVETGPCGNVVYGEGSAPPPATDPDARYPSAEFGYPNPEFDAVGPERDGYGGAPVTWGPMPGNPYSIFEASTAASRVRFETKLNELYKDWCALQTPVQVSVPEAGYPPIFSCAKTNAAHFGPEGCFAGSAVPGQGEPINCFKLLNCQGEYLCSCNSHECRASDPYGIDFDLEFVGDQASGTLMHPWSGEAIPVTLQRVE